MKSHLLIAVFLICFYFSNKVDIVETVPDAKHTFIGNQNVLDFTVNRMSGGRVFISWHTQDEPEQIRFEVMRQYGKGPFVSLGIVKPKSKEGNIIGYTFIDENRFSETSFYRLKKTKPDSVIFYSMAKEVAGIAKER